MSQFTFCNRSLLERLPREMLDVIIFLEAGLGTDWIQGWNGDVDSCSSDGQLEVIIVTCRAAGSVDIKRRDLTEAEAAGADEMMGVDG